MKKIMKVGWIAKTADIRDAIADDRAYYFFNCMVSTKRGRKWQWDINEWPPKKVRITVEEIE